MPDLLLIDGNNLLHRHPVWGPRCREDFDAARRQLIAELAQFAEQETATVIVVFDGSHAGRRTEERCGKLHVTFTPAQLSADTYIERIVLQGRAGGTIRVVTSDRAQRHCVDAAGGQSVGCGDFLDDLAAAHRAVRSRLAAPKRASSRTRLGDYFPD